MYVFVLEPRFSDNPCLFEGDVGALVFVPFAFYPFSSRQTMDELTAYLRPSDCRQVGRVSANLREHPVIGGAAGCGQVAAIAAAQSQTQPQTDGGGWGGAELTGLWLRRRRRYADHD